MRATSFLSARPLPAIAVFTSAGEYSRMARPRRAIAARIAPRAWASTIRDLGFMPKYGASTAAASGR